MLTPAFGPKPALSTDILCTTLSLCAFLALRYVFWEGFLGSDDSIYWSESLHWLEHAPYLANTHWGLRHTLILPIALAHYLLGAKLLALMLPTMLYSLGILAVVALVLRPLGRLPMCLGLLMVATNPQVVLNSSETFIDPVECFYLITAICLFLRAIARPHADGVTLRNLALSGIATGFAMISRETTVLYIAALGVLFLAGFGPKRWYYFVLGAGFAVVEAANLLFQWVMSGDALHNFHIAAHHDNDINRWVDQGSGVPPIHPLIDPVVMLLINHNFALLGSVGVGLLIWLLRASGIPPAARKVAILLGTVALVWTLIAAGWWSQLVLIPRYYLLPSILISVGAGLALALLWQRGRPVWALLLGGLLLAADMGGIAIDNRNYMFGETTLANEVLTQPETIHTDPETLRRAKLLLDFEGRPAQVTADAAGVGDLFYYNPTRAPASMQPKESWIVVDRPAQPESIAHMMASRLVPDGLLPPQLLERLRGHPGVVLYRVN